jgi:FAD/FMN-containing dehydrogenase
VWLPDESGELAAAETSWVRGSLDALGPHRAAGVYVNFLDADEGTARVRKAYGDETHQRLTEVKAKYDPDNAFHNNQNIRPE